ncbi:MAG: glucose 1-dehydrogenase [Balneolales bacterium]
MEQSPFSLNGKIALITGGGTGLGFGVAKSFIAAGSKVIITGRREEVLRDACDRLGKESDYIVNDVTDKSMTTPLVDEIEENQGPIDILVNNAGIHLKKLAHEVTDEEFQNIMQTNVNGVFSLTREVTKKMVERNRGSVIMITSMAALYGVPKVSAYTASKTAILGMTRSFAVELSPHDVRVNAIAPGFIDAPMLRKALDADPERKRRILERTPMNKFGELDDIGNAAVFLASSASKFITGVNLAVDGGNSIGF